ncbi:MAG: hypothetical protein SynsKO_11060 [Synoicihabitans sp.]
MYELYATPVSALSAVTHPLTNVREPEQDVTFAGNRRLAAEETEYLNLGFVWSPEFDALRGLTIGIDYWDITRLGTVESTAQDTVNRFFGVDPSGDAAPGGLLPGESVLLRPNGNILLVNSVFFNVGETKASGYDLTVNYVLNTDNMGRFEFSGLATMLDTYDRSFTLGGELNDLIGTDVTGTGDDFYIEWKGRVSVDWTYRDFNVYFGGSYTGGYDDTDYVDTINWETFDYRGDDTWIFDAQVSYNIRDQWGSILKDTKITLGARNLFDQDPPYASALFGNSTGYPGFLYNPEGQFFYVRLGKKL